jgi:transcriptional regulator
MSKRKTDVPYGTLELLVLKTLDTLGPLHGYAIARRIEQTAGADFQLSQGALYPAFIRLVQQGLLTASWRKSETNRRVKVYALTPAGRRQIQVESEKWRKAAALVARFTDVS